MALTRESSPVCEDDGSSTPIFLTPNSKIKNLLASLDDHEPISFKDSARDRLLAALAKPSDSTKENANISGGISSGQEETEDDEDIIIRPTGRMAARMQVKHKPEDVQPAEGKPLDGETTETHHTKNSRYKNTAYYNSDEDGDIESTPATPRGKKLRTRHRQTPKSSARKRTPSNSLFVSPQKSSPPHKNSNSNIESSDSDSLPENIYKNTKFMTSVQKKRKKQLIIRAEAANKSQELEEKQKLDPFLNQIIESSDSDGISRQSMTQQSRPLRKASKKALEDINRETQRILRQQQLTHKPLTKKKFTKESFFSKFNFKPPGESNTLRPTSSSPDVCRTDTEFQDTPPTSPIQCENITPCKASKLPDNDNEKRHSNVELDVSNRTLTDKVISSSPTRLNETKGQLESTSKFNTQQRNGYKLMAIHAGTQPVDYKGKGQRVEEDSDSDIEIIETKPPIKNRLNHLFDRVPAKQASQPTGVHALKMLALIKSPPRKQLTSKKSQMTKAELEISLQQRARQQAALEREERLEVLKAKGITFQTNEERERDQAELDDLLSKARAEALEIGKQEKAAKKKDLDQNEKNSLIDDSSGDEDWDEGKNRITSELDELNSEDEVENYSSDEEDTSEEQNEEVLESDESIPEKVSVTSQQNNDSINTKYDDADTESTEESDISNRKTLLLNRRRRQNRDRNIISDDEEETLIGAQSLTPTRLGSHTGQNTHTPSSARPNSVLRSATKNFIPGLPVSGPAGLGLTQIFAGTMDDSSVKPFDSSKLEPGQNDVDLVNKYASSPQPFLSRMEEDINRKTPSNLSQVTNIPQSQATQPFDSGGENMSHDMQVSQFSELTQDDGFAQLTPMKRRFINKSQFGMNSNISETREELKDKKSKRKLHRRAPQVASFSDEEAYEKESEHAIDLNYKSEDSDIEANVFDIMSKASKKMKTSTKKFDKKNSEAKEMFHEQAEESDDEYAGLGGASDDQSGSEEDEYIKDMIDDDGGKDVDEGELAAFFADRERANDEKQVEKLFNDISKGLLRRKRGADYELSDSDDDGEARRRHKQREFAKMRKALLADERINKIANNPKNQAFLLAIEDRVPIEEEIDFLHDSHEQENNDPQSLSQSELAPKSETIMSDPSVKEKSESEIQPIHLQQNVCRKKPTSLSEIRQSLSTLLDEPNTLEKAELGSESEQDDEIDITDQDFSSSNREKRQREEYFDPFNSALQKSRPPVIDRISLNRNSNSTSNSNNSRLAYSPSTSATGFTIPPLLRRTTNSSFASSVSSNTTQSTKSTERALDLESRGVKRGGTWGSGINCFSRETERRTKITKTELRRDKKLVKSALSRKGFVSDLFGAGKFE